MSCKKSAPYVISGDTQRGLFRSGFPVPNSLFFQSMAENRVGYVQEHFGHPVVLHKDEKDLSIQSTAHVSSCDLPVIALDQVYLDCPYTSLEVSRLCNSKTLAGQELGSRNGIPFLQQLDQIAQTLGHCEVQLFDDVIFTAKDLAEKIVPLLKERGITVKRIVVAILIGNGEKKLSELHPEIELDAVHYYPEVLDEVCERDFLAGVPQSGRLFGMNGVPVQPKTCAPYFRPWTRNSSGECFLYDWATLGEKNNSPEMETKVLEWSRFCLEQSIRLWEEIERLSRRLVHCDDLERRPWGIPCDKSRFVDHLVRSLKSLEMV